MTREEHLLTILAEECSEVAQRASKAIRFGLLEIEPGQPKTNAERIMDELNDLIAVYQMLAGPMVSPTMEAFRMDPDDMWAAIRAKQAKVEKFLRYSSELGTLDATKGA